MKFCTKCGAELVDDAIICTKCGRMVDTMSNIVPNKFKPAAIHTPRMNQSTYAITEKESLLLPIFNFVSSATAAIALFFIILAIMLGEVTSYFSPYGYNTKDIYSHFWLDIEFLVTCIITSGIAFACGLFTFILTLVKRQRGEKLFIGVTKLIIGFLLLLGSIIAMLQ